MANELKAPSWFKGFFEYPSEANDLEGELPVYPYNNIIHKSECGHLFEMDDTPKRERIRLNHMSGTYFEMRSNGDQVAKVYGDNFEITVKDKNVLVEGNCNITVNGDVDIEVYGDKTEYIHGNYELHVGKTFRHTTEQVHTVTCAQDMKISSGGIEGGALRLGTGDHIMLDCDLTVRGEFTADKITSEGRIDAGFGVSAGIGGFVTALGGISVGCPPGPMPVAIPGQIMAYGGIISLTYVTAPLGIWQTSAAILMADVINSSIYDMHTHATTFGPTGPPVPPFVGF